MISCKCDCIYNEHSECTKEAITISTIGCLSKRDIDGNVYQKAIKHYGEANQTKKLFEEINEFSDAVMGYGNIQEELADLLNMIEQFKLIHEISNEDLHDIMQTKMKRTLERIKGEQGQ